METDIETFNLLIRTLPSAWRTAVDRRLRPLGLSQSKWRAVYHAGGSTGPITQSDIAERLGIEAPTVVRLLDRLELDGWIERRPCPKDRRVRHIHLTPKALKAYRQIEIVIDEVREQIFSPVTAGELQRCNKVLQKLVESAKEAAVAKQEQVDG